MYQASKPSDGRCIIDFDHQSVEHAQNWTSTFRDLQKKCPVAWSESHGGYWIATRYLDIIRIMQDGETFTNNKSFDPETGEVKGGITIPPLPTPRAVPDETDSPEWERYRHMLNRRFAPKAAEARRESAENYASALMDRVIEKGEMDLVNDFLSPLPAIVTMELLGFPIGEWQAFADPLHEMMYIPKSDPGYDAAFGKFAWIRDRVFQEMGRCRRAPSDDLISYLVTERVDGELLDDETIQQIVFNVMTGGVDTTTALSSNVMLYLYQHPEDRKRLIENPDLLPRAREEFVRYFSPIHGLARTASKDVTIADQTIRQGERVLAFHAAANRDPEIFDGPDKLVLERFPNRHIAFGAGMHRCLGSFVARVMFETMVKEVLKRIPDYEIDVARCRPYTSVGAINGWIDMPASFTPGKKVGIDVGL